MKPFLELQPTVNQTFRLIGNSARGNLNARLEQSYKAEQNDDYPEACMIRYEAFEDILAILPDDEEGAVTLDRTHPNTLAAMEIILASAVDSYLADEGEVAAGGPSEEAVAETRLQKALVRSVTPAAALAYMVFILLYFPCIATFVAIKNEGGGWKWAIITAVYTIVLAWVAAFITFRIASLFI